VDTNPTKQAYQVSGVRSNAIDTGRRSYPAPAATLQEAVKITAEHAKMMHEARSDVDVGSRASTTEVDNRAYIEGRT